MAILSVADRTTIEQRFEFASMPEGWGAVVALGAVLLMCWAIVWMYRREGRRGAGMSVRMGLAAVRCAVILLLAVIWLQPVLATYIHRWIDSYCVVLVDDSSSMDLQDQYRSREDATRVAGVLPSGQSFPVRRADVATALLSRDDNRLLRELAKRNRVKLFTFSDAPHLVATLRSAREEAPDDWDTANEVTDAARLHVSLEAKGPATNPSRAIRRAVEGLGSAPLAGVVMLSDGGFNQGDPVDVLARYIEEHNIPLHVVGIGDPSPPKNVRVAQVVVPENAFKEDPFAITAHITTVGMAGEPITVELYERGAAETGSGAPVDRRNTVIRTDGTVEPVVFRRQRSEVGRVVYRISVPVGSFESIVDDNSKQATVNVIDDKMRVLLISGGPSWEYRYVSRLLTRDATFEVSCWLQSADVTAVRDGNTIIDHLPATPEELFEYDAVVLIDADPSEFGPGWAKLLETLVTDHGAGLLFVASRKFAPQFMRDPAVHRIVQLLPVSPDPEADLIINRIGHYQTRDWPVTIAPAAYSHPILRLGKDAAEARGIWQGISGVYWHYPVLREKAVASVLMRHSNPQMRNSYGGHVLLATQFVGAGRSAFMAFDSTWRWRRYGEELFDAYWVQMLRYLVEGKLLGTKSRATLLTEGETFQLGDVVKVLARLYDAQFNPLETGAVSASYRIGRRKLSFELKRSLDRPGWFEGRFTPDQVGSYEVSLTLPGTGGAKPVTATHEVQVVRPNIEILQPQMNRAALMAVAERSAEGGYYEVDQVDQLAQAIPDRHETTTVKSRPIQLWDRWWTLVALTGLLSIEWAVRKWVRLL